MGLDKVLKILINGFMGQLERRSDSAGKGSLPKDDGVGQKLELLQQARILHRLGPSGTPLVRFPKPEIPSQPDQSQ